MSLPLALIFLIGSSLMTALSSSIQRNRRFLATDWVKKHIDTFFFKHILVFFFKKPLWEGVLLALSTTKHLLKLFYVLCALSYLAPELPWVLIVLAIALPSLLCDCLFLWMVRRLTTSFWTVLAPIASCFLFLCLPLSALVFLIMRPQVLRREVDKTTLSYLTIKDKVYELLQDSELSAYLDPTEQQFLLSMIAFKGRIAREVMVPRINVFSLPQDTSIDEAAHHFLTEGYSRIPIYKDSVDNIIGVLLYKDVLKFYIQPDGKSSDLNTSIQKIVKPVIYTPETKKISQLLQDFRNKQIHMAIIVDEWGGTEGIVTIEDILEEIVGEIADEYDTAQHTLFTPLPGGSWIVDAKMAIIDIQEELNIAIPQSPEYDTIGGYIFNRAGSIPLKGWKIHHDDFELEVLSSNERAIEKIKISKEH
jgi:CBS domain containing-hemolysin-like protein